MAKAGKMYHTNHDHYNHYEILRFHLLLFILEVIFYYLHMMKMKC